MKKGGYYDENGEWIEASGYYDENGDWVETGGYYDENGEWVEYAGYYDENGEWVDVEIDPNYAGQTQPQQDQNYYEDPGGTNPEPAEQTTETGSFLADRGVAVFPQTQSAPLQKQLQNGHYQGRSIN